MQALRQVFSGILLAVLSAGLTLGGFSLAFAEGEAPLPPPPDTPTAIPTFPPTPAIIFPTLPIPGPTEPPSPTPSLSPTETIAPPTTCPPPFDWIQIVIQAGDSLDSLAQHYGTTPDALIQENCLLSPSLPAGSIFYVPPAPTQTPVPCGPPAGWIIYRVQAGDNLYRIGLNYGVTVSQLKQANCLGASNIIHIGQPLYVPNVPTRTPAVTATLTEMPTATPTATQPPTIPVPTATPTLTPPATSTVPPTASFTATTAAPTNTAAVPPSQTFTPTTPASTP